MQKTHILAAAATAALFALAGCNSEPEAIVLNQYDPMADELKNAAPVELPPAIADSRTYRCSDNSLLYVDFYTNNTARVRTSRSDPPTQLASTNGSPPFVGDGWSISTNAEEISATIPGKGSMTCHT